GAAVLAGRLDEARGLLDGLLAEDPGDREALTWRGEAALAEGRAEAALSDYDAVLHRTDNLLGAGVGQLQASLALGRPVRPFDLWVVAHQAPPALRPALLRLRPGDRALAPALRRLLAALGGNRTTRKTVADGRGGLRAYAPKPTAYDLGEATQTRIRRGDADAVLAAFARLERRLPREPQVRSFRGETWLWLGRPDEAERDFRAALALDATLRWPGVGLAGVAVLRGDWEGALARCAEAVALGARDRSWRVWAGEACLNLGRPEEAAAHLRAGLAATPRRVSAWMLLALAEHAAGRAEEAERLAERCRRGAPRFFEEAAAAAVGGGFGADLRAGLRLMRGNRSSWLWTYFDRRGRLRNLDAEL
ncbi:MAG: tetratricopeptide repeat protein, partial [Elusimicrobiota bacterium]|nr:tetratricopeptide repeat protein [Elusimicrobiota bacterium]